MKGFLEFIRERGVLGLAIGFILGGSVTKVVTAFLTDLLNPFLGLVLGSTKGLANAYLPLFNTKILYGHFLMTLLDFLVVAAVVYFGVKWLRLDKLDKKKETTSN